MNARGDIVSEGRNAVFAADAAHSRVFDSPLAHAEINALASLDPARRYEDHVLYASLEPCLLCVGAAVAAGVGCIRYAGADPYGGGLEAFPRVNPHMARVDLRVVGPREDGFGAFASALLLAYFMERKPQGHVVRAFAERRPSAFPVAERLVRAGAQRQAAGEQSFLEFVPTVSFEIAESPEQSPPIADLRPRNHGS